MRITAFRPAAVALLGVALAAAVTAGERLVGAQAPQPGQAPSGQAPPAGQPPPTGQDQPVFRTGINTVRVDVIVTDSKGNAVTDLKPEDFEVQEDGKAQQIEQFRLIKIDPQVQTEYQSRAIRSRDDEEIAARDENSRLFVIFLDDYNTRLENSMAVRRPLVEFITNQVGPNDLLAVMYPLTPLDAVVLTRNHQGIINTVEKFVGRKYNYEPINDLERGYIYKYPTEVVERIRRQVSLSALRGLSYKLGALREGRKSIILVSEGYIAMLPPQKRDEIAGIPGSGNNPDRYNPLAGENPSLTDDRVQMSAEMDLQQELRDVYDAANRTNTAIYAVDPRGLSTGEFDIADNINDRVSQRALTQTTDTLRVLADNTDGRAIVNRNDLGRAMTQIVKDASTYYLVGYNSSLPADGKFHDIDVRVKRPGLQIRSRKGYWAPTAADVAKAAAGPKASPPTAVSKALAAIAPIDNHRFVRTWFGTEAGDNGLTKVTFQWEGIAPPAGTRRDQARGVTLLAATADGQIVYRGKLPEDKPMVSFAARPGTLDLRITVDGDGGTIDREDRTFEVPDLTAPDVRLTTPRVWYARSALEFKQLSSDPAAVPAITREFRRTDRLLVRFETMTPAGAPATVSGALLNQQGAKMIDVAVAAPSAPGQPYLVDLPLANLAAGQYLLQLQAASEGHEPATQLVAFRVSN